MIYYDILNEACKDVGIDFNETMYNQLILYKDLIKEWNEKINLTAITEDHEIITKHFIDCIKIFKFDELKEQKTVIDVGTGAGFPGIPMKIVCPSMEVVLLDSLNKRINFLNLVIEKLNLKGISTIHGRAEDFARPDKLREKFDVAVSRAVANMSVLSEFCMPYVKNGKFFIALKGPAVEEELKESRLAIEKLGGKMYQLIPVDIQDSDLNHNLVVVKKITNTPKQYPRKAGVITKKPLK
ncbi:16S rRNA (guanine527-N7)-methyltransferase [Hathewaya proteolytica DSM 3090]|uniref:Ribosomal RNA small subunit methyltransferase G n=1 Tax=Hathewaya proteolytica DSM 3090 TaxID=1121331 RepID=A0A1M6MNB9_9CLOT|nr:16S rRNA (guanine(527)-N(7))-methyltransferase RsmG [Hathewaya proteolytica]SHJ84981.1 16S rRNA (guanine527-N7)-methyltransferase [Hathewaya proteolytica DSM 3090]